MSANCVNKVYKCTHRLLLSLFVLFLHNFILSGSCQFLHYRHRLWIRRRRFKYMLASVYMCKCECKCECVVFLNSFIFRHCYHRHSGNAYGCRGFYMPDYDLLEFAKFFGGKTQLSLNVTIRWTPP